MPSRMEQSDDVQTATWGGANTDRAADALTTAGRAARVAGLAVVRDSAAVCAHGAAVCHAHVFSDLRCLAHACCLKALT